MWKFQYVPYLWFITSIFSYCPRGYSSCRDRQNTEKPKTDFECKAAAALYIAATTKCFWTGETDNEPKLVSILEMWHCDISCHFTNIEITGYLWFACFTSGFLLNPTGFTKDRLLLCSSHCNWFPFFKMYVVWLSRGIEPGSCCYCKLLSLNPSMCLYQWSLCDYLDLHYIQLVHTDCMYYFIHPWMPVSNQF